MKQLKKYAGKEVEITFNTGFKETGILFKYYRTTLCRDGDYEYWLGYDGGFMDLIHPSRVKEVKVINEHPEM